MKTKKFLGIPVLKQLPDWKLVLYNVAEFILFFLLPAILFLHFVGWLETANTPFYIGLIAGAIGIVTQHIGKLLADKWVKMSFYNMKMNIIYFIVILISAFALFEIWGL